jgi:peptidoglycan/xylan/chitin deacetylase (PgdA/CDA1 family)
MPVGTGMAPADAPLPCAPEVSAYGRPVRTVPVLLYHRIGHHTRDRFAVSCDQFRKHVDMLLARERTAITIGELADCIRGAGALPARPVAITFDDGYEDTPAAVHLLLDAGLRATVYVTAGSIGAPGMITAAQVAELAERGAPVELGAHSVSHPHLDELGQPALTREIGDGRRIVEELIGRRLDTFAYPHGAYDARVRAAVIEAGFRSAAAVKNATSHLGDDPWAIARYTVTRDARPERVARLLDGSGAPMAWRDERRRTRIARAGRRLRRRLVGWEASA